MFFAYVLIVIMAVMLFRMRSQMASLHRRLDMLEGHGFAPTAQTRRTEAVAAASHPSPAVVEPPLPRVEQAPPPSVAPAPDVAEPRPADTDRIAEPDTAEPDMATSDIAETRAMPEAVAAATPARPDLWTPPARPAEDAAPVTPRPARARPSISFEELFGRRLPIWAGGATLAIAGVLIVKYSIDAGLLSPLVRVICGLLFGTALIGGAETALRLEHKVRDPRVAQALSGAGIASLYASILIAANLYGLIGSMTAFVGLAATTALAMGLSIRFGAPSALLGLVGGLAAPALVGASEPNVPLLATYLALAVGGLCTLSRTQRWLWLGVGALIGGFGWGAVLLVAGALDAASAISLGLFLVLLGIGLPLLIATGKVRTLIRAAAPLVAAVQLAALVATGGFGLLQWGLFALIAIAIVWLSTRDEKLVRLPVIGVVISLLLLGAWPLPAIRDFAIVALALAAIHAAPAVFRLWRKGGSLVEAGQVAAITLGGIAVTLFQFHLGDGSRDTALALVALAAALLPAAAAMLGWRNPTRRDDARFATLAVATALPLATATAVALPLWTLAPIVGLLAGALLLLSRAADDRRVEYVGWAFGIAALPLLTGGERAFEQFARTAGERETVMVVPALLRWTGLAAVATLFAWGSRTHVVRIVAQGLAAILAYAAIAQVMPATPLPLVPAIALAAIAAIMWRWPGTRLIPALASLFGLTLAWAVWPLGVWGGTAYISLIGEPMLASGLPLVRDTVLRLAMPAIAIGAALWFTRTRLPAIATKIGFGAVIVLAAAAGHILFKNILAMDSADDFVRLGLIERTMWEALLVAAGIAVRRWRPQIGLGIVAAAFAHFGWYTLVVHNPLWWDQAVGALPVISWLLPAYGLPLALLWLASRYEPALARRFDHARSIAQMVLVLMLGISVLRQLFAGSLLTASGVSDLEDILRSVVTIGMAIGFLLWGIARASRLWRLASLVLMILAVIKVFLFDASGLDGLARIGSFIALGLSLIGIGWLYSRQLSKDASLTKAA